MREIFPLTLHPPLVFLILFAPFHGLDLAVLVVVGPFGRVLKDIIGLKNLLEVFLILLPLVNVRVILLSEL
jgi:hypothetical protein